MKYTILKFLSVLFAITFVSILVFTSCEKDEDEGTAPVIPPQSAFVMDFSDFSSQSKSADVLLTSGNWGYAVINITVWNFFTTLSMVIPVASYVEAFNHEPEYQGDATWKWSYSFLNVYTADLYGKVQSDSVEWKMYITKSGEFNEFLWYSGTCDIAATGGYWIFNKSYLENHKLLQVDWTRDKANETGTIKYTNIEPGGDENGGYIYYGKTLETPYNAFFDIYNKGEDNLINIEWSKEDHSGRVKSEDYFGDTEWHCWDTNLQDVDCNQ